MGDRAGREDHIGSEMRLRALGALAVTVPALMLGLVFFKGNAAGQQKVASTKGELTGTWRLVSAQNEKKVDVFGPRPVGMPRFRCERSFRLAGHAVRLVEVRIPNRT